MNVSASGYYRWRNNKISFRKQRDIYLTNLIKNIHSKTKGRYGSPRIYQELKSMRERVSRKRVNRLMRENNLISKVRSKFKITTKSDLNNLVAPNLLKQNFSAALPNQIWVADISYILTQEGWIYLAITLDLCSRKVVGWHVSDRITKELVITAFMKAYWSRKPSKGLIHHSDRGSQYTSNDFQKLLVNVGALPSMSGSDNCYDNAVAESFFNSLKTELGNNYIFKTKKEAKDAIFEYIEGFYNGVRRHSTLNYCSPSQFEQYLLTRVA